MCPDDTHKQMVSVPVKYNTPASTITRLANQITLQAGPAGWYFTFYEAVPPLARGTPEEVQTQLEKLEFVEADCVARVFVPIDRLPEMLAAIQSTAQQFQAAIKEGSEQ